MEKIKTLIEKIEILEHSFYCDECGEYLGTSTELSDGWYKKYGDFELNLYVDDWYRIKKCLCNSCQRKFIGDVQEALKNLGFKE